MAKNYGVPYMGSKNTIAKWVVDQLPAADVFGDVFAGGCAVTHAAILSGKFRKFIVNDISDAPSLFIDAVNGRYKNDYRWVSREDFFKHKDTDPYVRLCFSFGNNGRNYIYSEKTERYKYAFHKVVVERDYQPMLDMFGLDFSLIDHIEGVRERRIACKKLVFPYYAEKGALLKKGSHFCADGMFFDTLQHIENVDRINNLAGISSMERIECVERSERLSDLTHCIDVDNVTVYCKDYRDLEIPDNAVVYCDPPYIGKGGYGEKKKGSFDHEAFYEWCKQLAAPVYVSEYYMPEPFVCMATKRKLCTFSKSNNSNVTNECIFTLPNTYSNQLKNQH